MVTARQKLLLRSSWELLRPMATHVADVFYDRLFELDPLLEERFPEDPSVQRPRFTKAIGAALSGLDDVDGFRLILQDLGRRNLSQGVKACDYVTLGTALIWTMEQTLAENFTPAIRDAWTTLHADLSIVLLQGAEARETHKLRERTQRAI